jgi:nitrilase
MFCDTVYAMRVAVVQVGSVLFDTPATLLRVEHYCREAARRNTSLLVFPEALLGGYPKSLTFGATIGSRTDEGRDLFVRYVKSSITCPGAETALLAQWAKELNLHIVIGVIERHGATLYCSGLVFTPEAGLFSIHRKLMPTACERLIWGQGDSTTLDVAETRIGRIGVAICWENYMTLYRQHLYQKQVQMWCAPTVDPREMWQTSMRHIAYEGRCFVLSACQYLTKDDWPEDLRNEGGTIDGKSLIVSPFGEVLACPQSGEGVLEAEINLDDIERGKFDLDVAGHYNRPDIFSLSVRESCPSATPSRSYAQRPTGSIDCEAELRREDRKPDSTTDPTSQRLEHLKRFYSILQTLESKIGGAKRLMDCSGQMGWPTRGVYFFREDGENRSDSGEGQRIVRVGTHALKAAAGTTLWSRLSQHRGQNNGGGNHRGSIFRLIVGSSLLHREGRGHPTWGEGNHAPHEVKMGELAWEREVSLVIGAMQIVWLPLEDDAGPDSRRGYIERNSIALLSNRNKLPLDPRSEQWLGQHCDRDRVRESGLWNSNHVDEAYDPTFLNELERLTDEIPIP